MAEVLAISGDDKFLHGISIPQESEASEAEASKLRIVPDCQLNNQARHRRMIVGNMHLSVQD